MDLIQKLIRILPPPKCFLNSIQSVQSQKSKSLDWTILYSDAEKGIKVPLFSKQLKSPTLSSLCRTKDDDVGFPSLSKCGYLIWRAPVSSFRLRIPSLFDGEAFLAYPHRPMTLHSPTENSQAVLNHKILEANSQVQNVKLGGHQTCLSINRLWHELCDMFRRLVGITAPGHHDCSIQE
ncbi:uncharacterized protein TNCV_3281691 [Trichonephila clavipes]|nr:uncharacterized protein TNCV_3281691 [Trichonephila clavipes]